MHTHLSNPTFSPHFHPYPTPRLKNRTNAIAIRKCHQEKKKRRKEKKKKKETRPTSKVVNNNNEIRRKENLQVPSPSAFPTLHP
jgi:glucan phosphorylase